MAEYSTVPAVLEGFYELLRAWPTLSADPDLLIRPAPSTSGSDARKAIVVGWNGSPDDFTSVEFDQVPEGLAGDREREGYTVRLLVEVLADDGEMTTAVAEAYELVAEIARMVQGARDPASRGVQIGTAQLLQAKLGGGTLVTMFDPHPRATLALGLVVDAFTASTD